MAKATKFHTFTLDFGSKLGLLKVNISKTAQETCPQNFTIVFTCLKSLKNGFIIFGGVFFLGIDFGSTCCVVYDTDLEENSISMTKSRIMEISRNRYIR